MRAPKIFCLVAALAVGCSTDGFKKGHGDAGTFILQQAIARGGKPQTNSLPSITDCSRFSQDEAGVVIRMSRDKYPAAEAFLRCAFGSPKLQPTETSDGGKLGVYRLSDKGGGIQFGYDAKQTQIIVLRPLSTDELFRAIDKTANERDKAK